MTTALQTRILLALLGVHALVVGVVFRAWIPSVAALVVCLAFHTIARRVGPTLFPGREPIAVWAVSFAVLFAIGAGSPFHSFEIWASATAWAVFCAVGFWAVHRYPAVPSDRVRQGLARSVVSSVVVSLFMAVGISALATLIIAVGSVASDANDPLFTLTGWGLLMMAYLAAGMLGGAIVGLLRPFNAFPLGAMAIGIPVAALVYGAVGIAMYLMRDPEGPTTLREVIGTGLGIGVIAGPVGGLLLRGQMSGGPSSETPTEQP